MDVLLQAPEGQEAEGGCEAAEGADDGDNQFKALLGHTASYWWYFVFPKLRARAAAGDEELGRLGFVH